MPHLLVVLGEAAQKHQTTFGCGSEFFDPFRHHEPGVVVEPAGFADVAGVSCGRDFAGLAINPDRVAVAIGFVRVVASLLELLADCGLACS